MYVLVPYNLSEIQKGIQAAHAIAEYVFAYRDNKNLKQWVTTDKTIIILNGGTTGINSSMSAYRTDLYKLRVNIREFNEPDLNDAMTAVAFLVDIEEDSHIIGYLKQMRLA